MTDATAKARGVLTELLMGEADEFSLGAGWARQVARFSLDALTDAGLLIVDPGDHQREHSDDCGFFMTGDGVTPGTCFALVPVKCEHPLPEGDDR